MGVKRKSTDQVVKAVPKDKVDYDGLDPWYLLRFSHVDEKQQLCSHFYMYSPTSVYRPDFEISIKYPTTYRSSTDVRVKVVFNEVN